MLAEAVQKALQPLNAACHEACHSVKPSRGLVPRLGAEMLGPEETSTCPHSAAPKSSCIRARLRGRN